MQRNASIWLIDDDTQLIEIINRAFRLERLTCQLVSFTNDADLRAAIDQSGPLPNLLVIDYYLPNTDGLQIIQWLQKNPNTQALKMILFSQDLRADIVAKAQELNVYQVTTKPKSFQDWRNFADELCLAGYFS
jgi:putative two-component system response regulator